MGVSGGSEVGEGLVFLVACERRRSPSRNPCFLFSFVCGFCEARGIGREGVALGERVVSDSLARWGD